MGKKYKGKTDTFSLKKTEDKKEQRRITQIGEENRQQKRQIKRRGGKLMANEGENRKDQEMTGIGVDTRNQ